MLLRVRMEVPHFWAVVEGEVMILDPVPGSYISDNLHPLHPQLKIYFSETVKYRRKSMHGFWNKTS